jgi:CBS domain-containing protein
MRNTRNRRVPLVCDYMTTMPHTIGADQPLRAARDMMSQHGIRHLPVLNDGRLVGLISQRDTRLADTTESDLAVAQFMSDDVYAVEGTTSLADAARYCATRKCGSVVVTSHERVVGIVTMVDMCDALADALA